jgi:membrane protease YdiL (CAAX protease family)
MDDFEESNAPGKGNDIEEDKKEYEVTFKNDQPLPEKQQHEPEESRPVIMGEIVEEDDKWYGVPPKGEQPLPEKQKYVLMILEIIVLEICIWGVYRYLTAPIFVSFGTLLFNLFHIIFAPTFHLIPILIFWRFFRNERGIPFVFTKKLIMSAVIVGFVAAIIWRLLEEFIYDGLAGAAGGTVPGTFTFFNLMSSSTVLLLSIMTFVQFFVVGPVEELEFRGFAYDQSSRVLQNWQALIFSSVLFGCSHIPIALFVYQFPPAIFVAALFGWITAGVVFGALFMWSRNIFACMVMHGMGNWQLSVFYFQSTELIGGMSETTYMLVSIATAIIVDGIMVLIFFLIHKYYWQPHRKGEPAFNGMFQSLQDFVHEHDFFKKPFQTTAVILVAFCVVICTVIMGFTHAMGETDLSKMSGTVEETEGTDIGFLESLIESTEIETGSGSLTEGQSETITLISELEKYIKTVKVTVTWTDEEDIQYIRTYENEPDIFTVRVEGINKTTDATGSNPHGGEGSISTELSFTLEEIAKVIEEGGDEYEISIDITLDDAGDYWSTSGLWGWTDEGNNYNYEIEIIWLVPE